MYNNESESFFTIVILENKSLLGIFPNSISTRIKIKNYLQDIFQNKNINHVTLYVYKTKNELDNFYVFPVEHIFTRNEYADQLSRKLF